jgi:glycosyltransferase involved in cell wall biosynthesis
MREGYVPKEQRKTILLLCDDIRLPSGVGNVGKETILSTLHQFNWINLGAGVDHPEKGKILDISQDLAKLTGVEDAFVHVVPNNGYGDPNILRQLIDRYNVDALFLITDPRQFTWLFSMENEIRKTMPIAYLNIWDDYPAPLYNKAFYESCDLLMGISKQTVNINKIVLGEKAKDKIIRYVPHGINKNTYFPIDENHPEFKEFSNFKNQVLGGEESSFTLFFNSRNIRRKQIPDTMLAWKYFLEKLKPENRDKVNFILHTELVSQHGTDLLAVKNYLFGRDYKGIKFSTNRLPTKHLNYFYNMADAQILLTSNEGWGLSLTEALLTATPIIANVTGGMQDQMRFHDRGEWIDFDENFPSNHTGKFKEKGSWAFPVFPTNRSLQGSPATPYIWDDRCSPEDAAEQIFKAYCVNDGSLKKRGIEGREWAMSDEAGFTSEKMGLRIIESLNSMFDNFKPRHKFEFINVTELEEETLSHPLIY